MKHHYPHQSFILIFSSLSFTLSLSHLQHPIVLLWNEETRSRSPFSLQKLPKKECRQVSFKGGKRKKERISPRKEQLVVALILLLILVPVSGPQKATRLK